MNCKERFDIRMFHFSTFLQLWNRYNHTYFCVIQWDIRIVNVLWGNWKFLDWKSKTSWLRPVKFDSKQSCFERLSFQKRSCRNTSNSTGIEQLHPVHTFPNDTMSRTPCFPSPLPLHFSDPSFVISTSKKSLIFPPPPKKKNYFLKNFSHFLEQKKKPHIIKNWNNRPCFIFTSIKLHFNNIYIERKAENTKTESFINHRYRWNFMKIINY